MNRYPPVSNMRVNRARSLFLEGNSVPSGMIPAEILRSWQRSMDHGVRADSAFRDLPVLSQGEVGDLRERNRSLLGSSLPVMGNLYEQIIHTSSVVILADARGTILHSLGDPGFAARSSKVSLGPGGLWSEEARGTNAIGTALVEETPLVVHSADHFASANHFLSCSASPIFDPYGSVLGVLDVSGDGRFYQQHTMALVRISAQQIENQLFSVGFEQNLVLHFHPQPEFVGTLYEGIVVFGWDGTLIAANRSALVFLGLDRFRARMAAFQNLFETSMESLLEQAQRNPLAVHGLSSRSEMMFHCRVKAIRPELERKTTVRQSLVAPPGEQRFPGLAELEFGDPSMQKVIAKVRQVIGHDIPVLIQGESGTGKELLARAMHYSGPRRNGPFVALNCAALPESLIESELFGYQEGAFTGAKRKGSLGKIRQADGGTLFLDEIGDMPLQLQTRLLRVLQDRSVTPLGDMHAHAVDFAVVCATHRKVRDEIAAGRFREDLYYRLNGLVVSLPPLKERKDLLPLAYNIINTLAGPGRHIRISQEVVDVLLACSWPGNIRQMHNVLRTAIVMLGQGDEIELDHLSEDFLEQCLQAKGQQEAAAPAPSDAVNAAAPLLSQVEMQAIRAAVQDCGGNLSAAARKLGICRNTLYRKLNHPG